MLQTAVAENVVNGDGKLSKSGRSTMLRARVE